MKTFEDLEFEKIEDAPYQVGVKCRTTFSNGYGASVVSHTYSYGGKQFLYEIAVLDPDGEITYETPVTDNVIGYLTPEEVTQVLTDIQNLPGL